LTIGTANVVTGGLIQAVLSWPLDGVIWALLAGLMNVMSVLVIVGVLYALFRRAVEHPKRLTYSRDATLILLMIGGLVTALFVSGIFEAARFGDQPGTFIANAPAVPLRSAGLSDQALEAGFVIGWWGHILLVSTFLCYLPGSQDLHIPTCVLYAYFRSLA